MELFDLAQSLKFNLAGAIQCNCDSFSCITKFKDFRLDIKIIKLPIESFYANIATHKFSVNHGDNCIFETHFDKFSVRADYIADCIVRAVELIVTKPKPINNGFSIETDNNGDILISKRIEFRETFLSPPNAPPFKTKENK